MAKSSGAVCPTDKSKSKSGEFVCSPAKSAGTFSGTVCTTGKSEAIRFEKSLFKLNPEFSQQTKVEAHVIGPGQMLVSVVNDMEVSKGDDPMINAFLSFIEKDIQDRPDRVLPVSESLVEKAKALTKDVVVSDDDDLGDDVSF